MDNLQYAKISPSLHRLLLAGVVIVVVLGLLSSCKNEDTTPSTAEPERDGPALAAAEQPTSKIESEGNVQESSEAVLSGTIEANEQESQEDSSPVEQDLDSRPATSPATGQTTAEVTRSSGSEADQNSSAEPRIPPTSPAPSDADSPPSTLLATLTISTVQITGEQIIVAGRSTLPDGTCIFARLVGPGHDVAWWPDDSCSEVSAEEWQIAVPIGAGDPTGSLVGGSSYTLHAWAEGEPRLEAMPFVLVIDDLDSLPPGNELPPSESGEAPERPPIAPTPAPGSQAPPATGTLRVTMVQVSLDLVVVGGRSTFPEEICIHTRLLADQESVDWWPEDECATVMDGRWQLEVPLGISGRPAALDNTTAYELSAWAQATPIFESVPFAFDLALPPS